MTNEQIDNLKGRELDTAFAEAFDFERWHKRQFVDSVEATIAALPDELAYDWTMGTTEVELGCTAGYWARFGRHYRDPRKDKSAFAPTLATALCRAALKAKAAQQPATPDVATRVKSITCRVCLAPNHPDHYASCWKCHAPSEGYFNIFADGRVRRNAEPATDAEDSQ